MQDRQTLLVGATGLLGMQIAHLLRDAGRPVCAIMRPTADSERQAVLRKLGIDVVTADLKNLASVEAACRGVSAIISTASATLSRQEGDSIQAVDEQGQLDLVDAAERLGVDHFVYVSFSPSPLNFALQRAKRRVEERLQSGQMSFTVLQPVHFSEIWLSPALGFDPIHGKVRCFGKGEGSVSWISLRDVARFAVAALDRDRFSRRVVPLGGPDPLSQLQVARIFEELGAPTVSPEFVPESELEAQLTNARDSTEEAFAALMLTIARGLVVDPRPAVDLLPGRLITIRDYATEILKSST